MYSALMLSVALTLALATTPMSVPKHKIEDLGYISGAWKCEIWGGTFEEYWTPPTTDSMQGCGRHLANGKTGFMEFMSIEYGKEGIEMHILLGAPSKGEKKPSTFKLTSFDGKTALFENPANDYPSKIAYVKESGGMSCWIEGQQNGKKSREDFKFKKK